LPDLAAGLVRLPVDVIVSAGDPAISAAKQATSTIPIVMASVGNPIGRGFVATSLDQEGTSRVCQFRCQLDGKRAGAAQGNRPRVVAVQSQVAVLRNTANPTHLLFWTETQSAAPRLGLKCKMSRLVARTTSIDEAFASMVRHDPGLPSCCPIKSW